MFLCCFMVSGNNFVHLLTKTFQMVMSSVTVHHWRGTGKVGQFAGHEGLQRIGGLMFHAF